MIPSVGEGRVDDFPDFLADVFVGHILSDDDAAMACRIDDIDTSGKLLLVLGSVICF